MGTSEEKREKFRVLQVSNISTQATKDQVYQLFQYLGRIEEFKLYPSDANVTSTTVQKFAYIRYEDEKAVELGQHLTNTVLIDRALVCAPSMDSIIPDEMTALNMGGPPLPGQRTLPPHVQNKTQDMGEGTSMLLTVDPTLDQLGLPQYPPLPATTDLNKVEEIRRTVYVGNLPKGVNGQDVMDFFNMSIGEVMYTRLTTGPDTLPCAYAFVEFSQQSSVPIALQNNMMIEYEGRTLRIQHSRVAIIKPQRKTADQALEEVEEAIRKKDSGINVLARSRSRSMSRRRRSPPRRTARSRSRSPRRRNSRDRSRDRERDRRRSRSKDKDRERDRDRERERERERDRDRDRDRDRKRSRSRDRERRRRSRTRSRDRKRSRSRSKERKDRDRKKDRREKDRKRSRSRSKDRKEKKRDRSRSRDKKRDKEKDEKKKKEEKKKDKGADSDMDENSIRERLLEKMAKKSESTEDVSKDVVATKISHQRKRKHTGSDSD